MRLIIIDGLDGVGKDTQAELLRKRYKNKGEQVLVRSHPEDDNFFGKKAKKALLGRSMVDKFKAAVFYMFDVLRSIRKYFGKKDIDTLIMVRYLVGTAYLTERLAKIAYHFFLGFVPISNYMFFLDADPDDLIKRVSDREFKEIFESFEEYNKVRKKALMLVKNWYIIDASGSIEDTYSKIEKILNYLDKD